MKSSFKKSMFNLNGWDYKYKLLICIYIYIYFLQDPEPINYFGNKRGLRTLIIQSHLNTRKKSSIECCES